MSPSEVRTMLAAVPFEPLRIILSDGTLTCDIADPQLILVTNRSLRVGIPANPGDEFPDRVVRLDLLHITQLVPLQGLPRQSQGNGQATG